MTDHRVTRRRFIQSGAAGAGVLAASSLFPGVTEVTLQQASAQGDDRGVLIMRGTDAMLPETFNPLLNDNRVWLYDGLVRFDEEMNPIPDLAESWEISEDGTVYTIKLREEVKFHDGTVMTADDVLYTAELTLDESINSPYRNKFIIDGEPVVWEKLDDYTVQATLPHPSVHSSPSCRGPTKSSSACCRSTSLNRAPETCNRVTSTCSLLGRDHTSSSSTCRGSGSSWKPMTTITKGGPV